MRPHSCLAVLLLLLPALSATAQQAEPAPVQLDVADLALEDLLNRPVEISTRTASTVDSAPGMVAVITREEIEASGAKTLGELIQMVPGYDSVRASLATGDPMDVFSARGVKTDFGQTTLVLLNGRNKFNDLMLASPWLSHRINADMIERIEVIRGPGSALYGGSAFAGVINVVTRDTVKDDLLSAYAAYGQNQQLDLHGVARRTLGGWHVGAQAKVFSEGGLSYDSLRFDRSYAPEVGGGRELRSPEWVTDGVRPSLDLSAAVSSPDDKVRVQVWHTTHNPHPFLTGFYPTPALPQYSDRVSQTMINAEAKPLEGLSIAAHYSVMHRDYRGLLSPVLGAPAINVRIDSNRTLGREDLFGSGLWEDNAQLDASYERGWGNHSFLFGVSFSRENMWGADAVFWGPIFDPSLPAEEVRSTAPRDGLVAFAEHARWAGAAFVQDQWRVHPTLSITLGLRYDRYLDVADPLILSPRAAVVWQPKHEHTFKVMYGQGFRPPSGFEQRGILFGSATGSASIQPERIFTAELAYITYLQSVRFQASGYWSTVLNNIVSVEDGDPNKPNRFANSGRARIFGGELELQGKHWWVNYSIVDSRSKATASAPYELTSFIAAQQFSAGSSIELLGPLTLSGQVFVRSPRLYNGVEASPIYLDADLKLRYRWRILEASVGVTNLFNQKYFLPLNDGGQYPVPYRRRELYVGLRITL